MDYFYEIPRTDKYISSFIEVAFLDWKAHLL